MSTKSESERYEELYASGYGIRYPESHIIRAYKHVVEGIQGGKKDRRAYDYGCGNGTHLLYLRGEGYRVAGCDTSPSAIRQAKMRLGPSTDLRVQTGKDIPTVPWPVDLYLCNQTIYYLDDQAQERLIAHIRKSLAPGGILILSYMSLAHGFAKQPNNRNVREMTLVRLDTERIKTSTLINFKTQRQIRALLARAGVRILHFGRYSEQIRNDEPVNHHYLIIAQRSSTQ